MLVFYCLGWGKNTRIAMPIANYSAGFYAENLLVYAPQAKTEGVLPLPIGENHKFAPVALGVSSCPNPCFTPHRVKPAPSRLLECLDWYVACANK